LERHEAFHFERIEAYLGVADVPLLPASLAHAKD
jgi:hypothetical protein